MRYGVLLLLLCATAQAKPDGLGTFKKEMRRLRKFETEYWRAYNNRFVRACAEWYAPIKRQKRSRFMEVDGDPSGFRRLYEDYALIEQARGSAYA